MQHCVPATEVVPLDPWLGSQWDEIVLITTLATLMAARRRVSCLWGLRCAAITGNNLKRLGDPALIVSRPFSCLIMFSVK